MFKYLSLPEIPNDLILDYEEFSKSKNTFVFKNYPYFKQYEITGPLRDYLDSIFNCEFVASYQVIRNGIAIHKDYGRTECINYLIETGGPMASLDIYDEGKNLLISEKIPAKKWHWIDVTKLHGVSNIESIRMSISIGHFTRNINEFI